jgi:hypothetical protein
MKTKKIRLEQAKKAVEFINSIEEVSAWMSEAEDVLKSDDLGKDVETAKALLKKQATLETELYQQEAKLTNMKETCAGFEKENHFAFLMLVKIMILSSLKNGLFFLFLRKNSEFVVGILLIIKR